MNSCFSKGYYYEMNAIDLVDFCDYKLYVAHPFESCNKKKRPIKKIIT